MLTNRTVRGLALLLPLLIASLSGAAERSVPSPEQFFGFRMGAEKKLAGWDRIVEYFGTVDRLSDRVVVQELGKTTMGRPYIMAVISAPDTIANLAPYQAMQKRLADPRATPQDEAARIARDGKAVLLIGANVHATEIGTSQAATDLLYKLAGEESAWVDHVLQNVIVLLIPSENPDGQQMVVDWYSANLGTPYEGSPLPELYHKYVGHDNNRDSYMLTQIESQYLARVTYKEWLPEVYLDKHEMSSNRARIFVPPYKNPPNPNVDPLVWSEVNLLGQAMATKLHEANKPGVIWGEQYTGFWQGANSTNPWWHNMVALLTETASSRLGGAVQQEMATIEQPRPGGYRYSFGTDGDPAAPLPPPTDLQYRMNYPMPWLGGTWTPSDVVEYEVLAALGALEAVANNREMLKRNFYLMNRRTIERYAAGAPYAYVVPPAQRDPLAAAKLVQLVQAGGGEVHRADAPFGADSVRYPAGTHVILLAQPFGRWIKDLLEPQKYPDIRWPHANAPIDRPYDVSAWTLGMLMGVDTPKIDRPFQARLTLLPDDASPPPGRISGSGTTFVLRHEVNASAAATSRLLAAGADVRWLTEDVRIDGEPYAAGAIVVSDVKPAAMAAIADALYVDVHATSAKLDGVPSLRLRTPRVAVYEPWGGNMDAGWTRWLLEQHDVPYTQVRPPDLRTPDLIQRYDVILLPEMSTIQMMRGNQARHVRPEYRGGIGDEGVRSLRQFLQYGGTVVTLGNSAQFAIEQLGAPFENVVQNLDADTFFCPGSLLRISLDTRHPVAYGMPEEADAMFINNGAFVSTANPATSAVSTVARYAASGPLLRSGWIIGDAKLRGQGAVLEAKIGRGRIIMHTFRVQSRAQTWGTFKLLFNSIFYGAALAPAAASHTSTLGD